MDQLSIFRAQQVWVEFFLWWERDSKMILDLCKRVEIFNNQANGKFTV